MSSIVPNPESYFRQFIPKRSPILQRMEAEALRESIPIVGPVVGELLFLLAKISGAAKILEFGTASGYSAIYLGNAARDVGGTVVSLEADAKRAAEATANIRSAGLEKTVEVRCADALETVAVMGDPLDMVFLDIEKKDYASLLPHCTRLVRKGGLLVADNVGFADADPFNRLLFEAAEWRSVQLFAFLPEHSPEKDGIAMALRL
jgi:predicted O-methyltransferase YrrM